MVVVESAKAFDTGVHIIIVVDERGLKLDCMASW